MSNEKAKSSHKRKLLILLALLCAPVLISYAIHYSGYRPGSMNYGELIDFRVMEGDGVNQFDNTIFRARDMHSKWTMLMVDSGNCDEACREKIYYMRQVRTVQNKEMHRVERVWLIDDDLSVNPALFEEFEGTFFVNAKGSELLASIPADKPNHDHIYLVDPLGNLMMRFPKKADPSLMVKDIKHLLHVSQVEH